MEMTMAEYFPKRVLVINFFLAFSFISLSGVFGDQGPVTKMAYADFPQVLRFYSASLNIYIPVYALSKFFVILPKIENVVYRAEWDILEAGNLDDASQTTLHTTEKLMDLAHLGVYLAKPCPALKHYDAIDLAAGLRYDYAKNITASMLFIHRGDSDDGMLHEKDLLSMTTTILADEYCGDNADTISCTENTQTGCEWFSFYDSTILKAHPVLYINNVPEGFAAELVTCNAFSEYLQAFSFKKFEPMLNNIILAAGVKGTDKSVAWPN